MNLLQIRKEVQERLKPIGDMYARESDWIIEHVLACDKAYLLTNSDKQILSEEEQFINELVNRRLNGEPLQYIIGSENFMGLDFQVSPAVLIPRFDTEILVNKVFDLIDNYGFESKSSDINTLKILDIGTGSGIIPIMIAKNYQNVKIYGGDISNEALKIASINARTHMVSDNIQFVKSDLFEAFLTNEKFKNIKFDIVVSNPPYIPTDEIENLQIELKYEPKLALDGGKDGYDFYRNIIAQAPKFIKEGGWLVMETGHNQAQKIAEMMSADFANISIYKDVQSIQRVVCGSFARRNYV